MKILVLGVGNLLLSDEGIGVRTIEMLQRDYVFPDNVTLMEGGTLGMVLMDAMMEHDMLIVLDAVLGGEAPGTIYRLTGEGLRKSLGFRDSTHQLDLLDTLIYCDMAGHKPEALVLGMQPADYHTLNPELTPQIQAALPNLAQALFQELKALGVHVEKKP